MILIYSSNHEPAPTLDAPLIEHNAERHVRPIYRKMRKVRGKTGWILRRYGHVFGAPKNDPERLAHHALQIGEYVYELTREKELVGQRLTVEQAWPSTINHVLIGCTDLSDEEIQMESVKAQAYVRSRNGGKYHIKYNNCQTFITDLLSRVESVPASDQWGETSWLSDAESIEKPSLDIVCNNVIASNNNIAYSDLKADIKRASAMVVTVKEVPPSPPAHQKVWETSDRLMVREVAAC